MNNGDVFSIHDDYGRVLAENVRLNAVNPYINKAMTEILKCMKGTAIIDLKKLQDMLKTGEVGGTMLVGCECQVPGREVDLPLVKNAKDIAEEVRKMVEVTPGDDTRVHVVGRTLLVIRLPTIRLEMASDYSQVYLVSATAVAYAIIKVFQLGIFDGIDMVKSALLGRYPQTISPAGGAVSAFLSFPSTLEGGGVGYRTVMVNDIVAITNKRTFDAAAISSVLEHASAIESGKALGPFMRYHLLGLAYQGLNANNMVYELVRDHGNGLLGDIIDAVVKRAEEDGIIRVKEKLPSGYKLYTTNDTALWNAYASAGQMAAVIQNAGASRAVQGSPSAIMIYNDLLSVRTGLPSVDFGRSFGNAISVEWLTHCMYGGGGPGVFTGEHVVSRFSPGFFIPCLCAAMCMDAGTQTFSPEMTSKNKMKLAKVLPELEKPMERIADAAKELEG